MRDPRPALDDMRRALLRIEEIAARGREAFFSDWLLQDAAIRNFEIVGEVKGHEREQDRAKYAAAEKWVRAVNHHGGFGRWGFVVCKEPNGLRAQIDAFATGLDARQTKSAG